jgi:hypothetical protein
MPKDPSADNRGGIQSQAAVDRATGLALQADAAGAVQSLLAVPASADDWRIQEWSW